MDEHVEVPTNSNAVFLEFVGLAYDAGIVLQDEFEDGLRTSLDKFDKYFYEGICNLLRNNNRPYTFQVNISLHERGQHSSQMKPVDLLLTGFHDRPFRLVHGRFDPKVYSKKFGV